MKAKSLIVAIMITAGIIATSCGSSKHACPAYGQNTAEVEQCNG